MENSRKNQRIAISIQARITDQRGNKTTGKTKDMSFGGISVVTNENFVLKKEETYSVTLYLESADCSIELECRPIHKTGNVSGFSFLSICGLNCYEHFKNLMIHNSSNPEELAKELEKHPGIIPSGSC